MAFGKRFRDRRTGRFIGAETARRSNAQRKRFGRQPFYVDVARQQAARKGAETRRRRKEEREEILREEQRRIREEIPPAVPGIDIAPWVIEIAIDYQV